MRYLLTIKIKDSDKPLRLTKTIENKDEGPE